MGRLRTATVKCNYKVTDRQLKEQFICGLNNSEILTEIIRELTKSYENMMLPRKHVLTRMNRVEAQGAKAVVNNSLHEVQKL